MTGNSGGLYPGVPVVPLARRAGTPLAKVAAGRAFRVPPVPLGAAVHLPGGGGGAAPPRPLVKMTKQQ